MRLVVLGAPGAGKGTQSRRLAGQLGVPHIASGDMFRKMFDGDAALGERLRYYMDRGNLVPDDLTNELMEARLSRPDAADGFVLDGYPRNVDQAKMLDEALAAKGIGLDRAVHYIITEPDIVARLAGRRVCPVDGRVYHLVMNPPQVPGVCDMDGTPLIQREDDHEEPIRRRLEVYGERTRPLYGYYREKELLVRIDAIGTTDEVYARTLSALGLAGATAQP
ncbi:MAG: adenylate kinase [Actinomycetota bacterium]